MTARSLLPHSLAGRTLLLLLVTALIVYLGGIAAYRLLAQDAAERGRIAQIGDRLEAAVDAIEQLPASDRPAASRALSSATFRVSWSKASLVDDASAADPDLLDLRQRLIDVDPRLSGRPLHLRWDEHALGGAHTVLVGAAGLRDGSFVVFSAAMAPTIIPVLPGAPLVASLVFASVIVVAFFVLRTINAPLRRLAQAADQYGRGKSITLPERGPREIVQAERAFNAMQRRIQRLIADRTQALAAVSHDLRTPIARLQLRCGLLADATVRGEWERDLLEMETMIEATLAYLRGDDDTEVPRLTDIASMLTTLVDAAVDAGYQATLNGPRHAVLMVRGLSVKRAVTNLINNALAYGDTAWVTLEQTAGSVRIVIDDDGPGIPESELQQVFEPFHRLDDSRNRGTGGVGLGLTIARQAIEREGGTLHLLNRAGGGLRAEIWLPTLRSDGAAAPVGTAPT